MQVADIHRMNTTFARYIVRGNIRTLPDNSISIFQDIFLEYLQGAHRVQDQL